MSSITAQQTKLDLKLVPKENRLDIEKCNGRIPRGLTPREPTFQVIRDAIALTLCYSTFLITADVPEMHQPWRTFAALINRSLSRKTSGIDKLRLSRAQIRFLGFVPSENCLDYVALLVEGLHLLRSKTVSTKSKKKDVNTRLPKVIHSIIISYSRIDLEMKDIQGLHELSCHTTCDVPPKIARKFKKVSPSNKDSIPVQVDEEPVQKGKQVKRFAKKSSTTPAARYVLICCLKVALAEKAQLKEVRKKSLRDFHKTYPSSSGIVAEKPLSVEKITPTVTSEGTGDKQGVPYVIENDSTKSEYESWGNDEDDNNNEQEASDEGSGQEHESEEQEFDSEQDEESDDDNQEEEEVDQEMNMKMMRLKTDKEVVQGEGIDVEMIDAQQGNENLETTQEQVVKDAHVTISTIMKKTDVPATSSSRSSHLASKFLNFLDIPHNDAEIVSPLDVQVHHEVPRTQAPTLLTISVFVITESSLVLTNIPQSSQTFTPPPILTTPTPPPIIETINSLSTLPDFALVFRFNDRITSLEKEVVEIKKDPLHTQVTSLVDEHLDTRLGETREEFMNFLSESLTARIKEQVKDQLPQILPKEVSNFAPPMIIKLIKEPRDEVTLAKVSSQPQSTYEAASTLTEFELKKILLDKMEKSESYLTTHEHRDCYDGLKKSYALDKDFFYSYDVYSLKRGRKDKDKDEDLSAGSD
ncbi:hypothetical protein Tco_0682821 [Tanacetum coccineum]|uniref:Uncharacterized protein n=1 Tax=Tanacetum coccineum TaxID=301880 RepID=A0ABQ4XT66_9ASTR